MDKENKIIVLLNWVTRLAYINLIWILFTIFGLGVFGVMPASHSMVKIMRQWIKGEEDLPIFLTFWQYYKQDFIKTNMIGLILFIFGIILFFDLKIIISNLSVLNSAMAYFLLGILLLISFLYIITSLYILPVYAHYKTTLVQHFKIAFILGVLQPIRSITMLILCIIITLLLMHFPGIIFFFSASLYIFVITWMCYKGFIKIEEKS